MLSRFGPAHYGKRIIRWSCIRIEPALPRWQVGPTGAISYGLRLPLIDDGRIAHVQLDRFPDQAKVIRFGADSRQDEGLLVLHDNQWTCAWQSGTEPKLPAVRLIGARFALGDTIGVRPADQMMQIFHVIKCNLI